MKSSKAYDKTLTFPTKFRDATYDLIDPSSQLWNLVWDDIHNHGPFDIRSAHSFDYWHPIEAGVEEALK
jgi:hypothetical protein